MPAHSPPRLDASQKRVLLILSLVGLAWFILFIFPNLTGARDAGMLAVFETDEYAQYPHLIQMLTPGDTLYHSIRNFAVYLHYYYGYPFYFFSAVLLFPLKLLLGSGWIAHTPVIMAYLRQMINVLPILLSAGLWVWIQTRFKPAWMALTLFALLLLVPAVWVNNFWWHPDSLLVLFVTLTFFFLDRDDLRFGRNFYYAAAACGLATGAKHLGLFFVLAVPVYILYGLIRRRITLPRAALAAFGFVAVMAAAVLISNPLLFLPQERAEIIATQRLQWQQSTQGYWTFNFNSFFQNGQFPLDIREHYGQVFFLLAAFLSLVLGLWRRDRRLLHLLILAWVLPFTYYFVAVATTRRTHYFLPVALPLFSCLVNFYVPSFHFLREGQPTPSITRRDQIVWIGRWAVTLLVVLQAGLFLWKDANLYIQQVNKERDSAALAFSRQVETRVLSAYPSGQPLVIYHDWKAYVRPGPHRRIEMNWDLATFSYIRDLNPDVILLERGNIDLFAPASVVDNAINPGNAAALHEFYAVAASGSLPGYRLAYQDGFGIAYVRN